MTKVASPSALESSWWKNAVEKTGKVEVLMWLLLASWGREVHIKENSPLSLCCEKKIVIPSYVLILKNKNHTLYTTYSLLSFEMNGSGGGKNVGHTWNKNVNCIKEQQLLPACCCYNTCGDSAVPFETSGEEIRWSRFCFRGMACHGRLTNSFFFLRNFCEKWHFLNTFDLFLSARNCFLQYA